MTFPTITFKHTNVAVDHQLQTLITGKLSSLDKYLTHAQTLRCEVEIERIASHQSGPICRLEANIWRSGKLYRADAVEETFEKAIDEVRRDLERDLERDHGKRLSVFRRGARQIKEMLRWGR